MTAYHNVLYYEPKIVQQDTEQSSVTIRPRTPPGITKQAHSFRPRSVMTSDGTQSIIKRVIRVTYDHQNIRHDIND